MENFYSETTEIRGDEPVSSQTSVNSTLQDEPDQRGAEAGVSLQEELAIKKADAEAALQQEIANKRAAAESALQKELTDERTALMTALRQEMAQKKQDEEQALRAYKEKRLQNMEASFDEEQKRHEETQSRLRAESRERLDREIHDERAKRLEDVRVEVSARRQDYELELSEQQRRLSDVLHRIAEAEKSLGEREKALDERESELKKEAEALTERDHILADGQMDLKLRERMNEQKARKLKEQQERFESLAKDIMGVEQDGLNAELAEAKQGADDLRRRLTAQQRELNEYYALKAQFGTDPSLLMKRNQELEASLAELRDELAGCPSPELQEKYDQLVLERNRLKGRCDELGKKCEDLEQAGLESARLQREIAMLKAVIEDQKSQVQEYEGRCQSYQARLNRLSTPETVVQDQKARISEITKSIVRIPCQDGREQPQDEMEWLDHIQSRCDRFGIKFPRRILYAFHTSLKITDWSSIVVLAGVSGTGKSELPRLYSLFGGINFLNVPVQPNWDSQESMLGYFNSIDNRFDAQPLLRFLAQCTRKPPKNTMDESMLGEYMSIVLLDEMNLAHVELYFADFLSKLEQRRGITADMPSFPKIEVKLGTGMEPYKIPMGRNVLWVGTMNQDETTKSLSDKVLDRGVVINFPRPRTLQDRESMGKLSEEENPTMLKYSTWSSWCRRYMYELKTDEYRRPQKDADGKEIPGERYFNEDEQKELDRFKSFVEELNEDLDQAGRAIGHRVWQSIAYYILNYPTVISGQKRARALLRGEAEALEGGVDLQCVQNSVKSAMKTAFEDQIVQKIMPKLRGIETRGEGGKLLQKIKGKLDAMGFSNLLRDFDNACERGYGQFVWNSAEYLEQRND